MKKIKDIERSYTSKIVEEITCDLCDYKIKNYQWTTEPYQVKETVIKLEEGSNFPEGKSTTTISFDICPECFNAKLIPWMKEQGAKPTITEQYD